jgi:hypothetical protein
MAKIGRPFTYHSDEERPVTISLRIPRDLYEQARRYVAMRHPMTLTDLLRDGLRLRLDILSDPSDMILSADNTVIQEVQAMIRAAVQAEIGKLSDFLGPHGNTPAPEAAAVPIAASAHDSNAVIQQPARRGAMRARILALLREHPEGLTADELRFYLKPRKPLGDTLQGMVRQHLLTRESNRKGGRYLAL